MKRTSILMFLFALLSTFAIASDFLSLYPMPGSECGGAVATLKNGKSVQAAVDFTTNGQDVLILTTDDAGNLVRAKRIGTSGSEQAEAILATRDGGFIVAGSMNNGSGEDGLLVKFNASA